MLQPCVVGLTTSRAFFVGDVNIFGMLLFMQIRCFFVNNRNVFVLGLQNGVTVIWVPSCFVYITSKYVTAYCFAILNFTRKRYYI